MSRSRPASRLQRPLVLATIWVVLVASLSAPAAAQGEINTGHFGNVAIQGYDPVAYFTERKAIKGSERHSHKWLGVVWRFANEQHKQLFIASPQTYAPQYGGHCASGLAIHGGLTKDIDPEAWAIIDNKLYLNYSKETNELLTGKIVSLEKSEANWKKARPRAH